MAVTFQVGQTGTLTFMPNMVGIDAARVLTTTWSPHGESGAIEFREPDEVIGHGAGTLGFTLVVTLAPAQSGPEERLSYVVDVECMEPVPFPTPSLPIPIAISVLAPPVLPPPPAP